MRLTTTFQLWVGLRDLIVGICLALSPLVAVASDQIKFQGCEKLLKTAKRVEIDFSTVESYGQTAHQIILGVFRKTPATTRGVRANLSYTGLVRQFDDIRTEFYDQLAERARGIVIPEWRKTHEIVMKFLEKHKVSPTGAYADPQSERAYAAFATALQRFASLSVLAYAVQGTDLLRTSTIKILELGVGLGDSYWAMNRLLPAASVEVSDKSDQMINGFQRRYPLVPISKVDFRLKPGERLPYPDQNFHVVYGVSSISRHLLPEELYLLLKDLQRVLKPRGYVVFDYAAFYKLAETGVSLAEVLEQARNLGYDKEPEISLELNWRGTSYLPIVLQLREVR
ncbi:MAG: methyltransferase domain-containing protein [Bdellovibrionota bacterium]